MDNQPQLNSSLRIERRSYLMSLFILLALIIVAGILTSVVPQGSYQRIETDGQVKIIADSYQRVEGDKLPIWRWFTAPIEVLWGSDALVIWMIILFLVFIGGSFAILTKSGMIVRLMQKLVKRFEHSRFQLMAGLILFFMLFGSVFGIFEEMVVLVPLVLVLARSLGWDELTGLGMSLLASGLGFSVATLNPFTLGVAQQVAGLPAYSGLWLRLPLFLLVYAILFGFLYRYARQVEKAPSLVANEAVTDHQVPATGSNIAAIDRAIRVFGIFLLIIPLLTIVGFFWKTLSNVLFPIIALLFLSGGLVAGKISRYREKGLWRDLLSGVVGIAPAIILILMASSIKHIVVTGGIMDTLLYTIVARISGLSPAVALIAIFLIVMTLNFFISSGSAKALLVLPILIPLVDMIGITRQTAVQSYLFGDGFSNVLFPTNAVLMIALGLSSVSWPRWLRFTLPLQLLLIIVSIAWLFLCLVIGYGPM
ncbi:MAG TPA: YfcC family protein [Clostridiaceae bacterium]|nr:YfcC family protein [Clostridiaceae bacterium]